MVFQVDSSVFSKDIPICTLTLWSCSPSQLGSALCGSWGQLRTHCGHYLQLGLQFIAPLELVLMICQGTEQIPARLGAQDQPFLTFGPPWLSFALSWPWAQLGRVGARGANGLAVKCAQRKRRVMQGSGLG